ncbi:endoglucanase-4, partial [Lasiosphaeria miniovina]
SALSHSLLVGVVISGKNYHGYDPRPGAVNFADRVGWLTTAADQGFVSPASYNTPDIVCHRGGTPPPAHVPVRPGDRIKVQWNGWPEGHRGPVLSYLAPCDAAAAATGDGCASVSKTRLAWTKIDEGAPGLFLPDTPPPGDWASNHLAANNNSWEVGLPLGLAPGPYVLRHEIIALHYAAQPGGAQNYPLCVNLWVQGAAAPGNSKTTRPFDLAAGIPATQMYKDTDPGILINISQPLTKAYVIPGPPVGANANSVPVLSQAAPGYTAQGVPVLVMQGSVTVPYSPAV